MPGRPTLSPAATLNPQPPPHHTHPRYNEDGIAWLPALDPGDPLWPDLIAEAKARKQAEAEAAAAAEAAARAEAEAQAAELAAASEAARAMVAAATAAAESASAGGSQAGSAPGSRPGTGGAVAVGDAPAPEAAAADAEAAAGVLAKAEAAAAAAAAARTVVVLYGPPLAGTSTHAKALAARYGVPVASLDSLLQVGRGLGGGGRTEEGGCGFWGRGHERLLLHVHVCLFGGGSTWVHARGCECECIRVPALPGMR